MNNLKTFMLMAVLAAVLVGIGYAIGGPSIAIVFLVIAGVMNFGMFWFSDKLVLRMSGARGGAPSTRRGRRRRASWASSMSGSCGAFWATSWPTFATGTC